MSKYLLSISVSGCQGYHNKAPRTKWLNNKKFSHFWRLEVCLIKVPSEDYEQESVPCFSPRFSWVESSNGHSLTCGSIIPIIAVIFMWCCSFSVRICVQTSLL